MFAGELMFHFSNTIIITALVAMFVLWRYRVAVLKGMSFASAEVVEMHGDAVARPASVHDGEGDEAAALAWERITHRRVICAWLLSVAVPAPLLAAAYLAGSGISPTSIVMVSGVILGAAVPMIAVSLAWTWKRGGLFWVGVMLAGSIATVGMSMLQRMADGRSPTLDQLLNALLFFQFAAVFSTVPLLLLLASGGGKLRGVVPFTFAGLLVFGLAPVLGAQVMKALAESNAGTEILLSTYSTFGMHTAFVAIALPTGWIAWRRLQAVATAYEAKRFSDVQLLARAWWLMFIATMALEILNANPDPIWPLIACVAGYPLFVGVNRFAFRLLGVTALGREGRTLLLLRVFGYTRRTERLFDRIGARWRYFGPVTMIAAPDVVARSIDPADYLHYMLGAVDESFVRSAADLQRRLETLDVSRDPDGRFRVDEFCCADTTWRATVLALMQRADAVLMDLRGVTSRQRGCEFELQQLGVRISPRRIVLVVDAATDRAFVRAALGAAAGAIRFYDMDSVGSGATDKLFRELARAAG